MPLYTPVFHPVLSLYHEARADVLDRPGRRKAAFDHVYLSHRLNETTDHPIWKENLCTLFETQ
jgi:hypothetical protein